MNNNTLILLQQLENTYIKNDKGECRNWYFYLCQMCGLHKEFEAEDYQWPWIFESGLGLLQHAPERLYVREKRLLTLEDLQRIESLLQHAA